ncbi:hypothetical protein [Echinicola rosea]|uniref:Uncharacterized protein n=1 Tax=Echinicola rosea TaxID=1807691 RepID=A0ABQ1V1G4_9BACT|nr:hypothetical protein [Echinicola rosea]GGF34464.1 hypothetical protein GCM10011339_23420 [Echinicola rosea]
MKNRKEAIQNISKGIQEMEAAMAKIKFNDEAFDDDSWYFDWVMALENRIQCLKESFQSDFKTGSFDQLKAAS